MNLLEERTTLILDFIPELMFLLTGFSTQGFRVKKLWGETVANVSDICPTCNTVVLFINKDTDTKRYFCRECGGLLPSDQLIVKLRELVNSPESPNTVRQKFQFEPLSLWRGYHFKGIKVGELFSEITRNLCLYDLERDLETLLDRARNQKQMVTIENINDLNITENQISKIQCLDKLVNTKVLTYFLLFRFIFGKNRPVLDVYCS